MVKASQIIGILSISSLFISVMLDNFALMLLSVMFSLVGIPLGIISARKGKSTGLILSIISLVVFILLVYAVYKLEPYIDY